MTVLVILQFTDEEMAKGFVKASLSDPEGDAPMKVWGVYKKATTFCECVGGKKTVTSFTRGRKFGWWVCAQCKKPTKKWASGGHWFGTLGTNLLPRALRPYPEEMPESLESPVAWSDVVSSVEA